MTGCGYTCSHSLYSWVWSWKGASLSMPQFRLLFAGNLAELQSSILNFHLSLEKAVSHLQMKRKNIFLPGDEFLQLLSFCFYRQFQTLAILLSVPLATNSLRGVLAKNDTM